MLTRKTLLAAAVVAMTAAAASGGAAFAQPMPGQGPGGWHHGSPLLDGVTLTDDQKSKLGDLMTAEHQGSASLRAQLRTIHDQIETTLLSSGDVTEATLAPLEQQEAALMQQLGAKRISMEIAVRNLLSAAQLAEASSTHTQLTALHNQERALDKADAPPADQGP